MRKKDTKLEGNRKILKVRHYKYHDVQTEKHQLGRDEEDTMTMKVCYDKSGEYLGDPKMVNRLIKEFGITQFAKRTPDSSICSVGYSPGRRKWYGWSHRAIFGFRPGSKVKKGSCGYKPSKGEWVAKSYPEAKQMAMDFAEGVS